MQNDLIIEKIKKLLRMKRGGTPEEVATALRLAQELADKHSIDLAGVNADEAEARPLTHDEVYRSARIQAEVGYSGHICQAFFNVTTLITDIPARSNRRGRDFRILFIGEGRDRQIARYVFEFLCGQFRREWSHRSNKRLKNRKAFMHGMHMAICHKLAEKQPETNEVGLVWRDRRVARRDEYLKNEFGECGKRDFSDDSDARTARYAGFVAGQKTEIRPGLEGSAAPKRAALQAPSTGSGQAPSTGSAHAPELALGQGQLL